MSNKAINEATVSFASCALVRLSLSVTGKRDKKQSEDKEDCCTVELTQGKTRSHGAAINEVCVRFSSFVSTINLDAMGAATQTACTSDQKKCI